MVRVCKSGRPVAREDAGVIGNTTAHDSPASLLIVVAPPLLCRQPFASGQHEQLPLTQLQIAHRAPHWPFGTPLVELEQVEHVLPGVVQLATPQQTPSVQ